VLQASAEGRGRRGSLLRRRRGGKDGRGDCLQLQGAVQQLLRGRGVESKERRERLVKGEGHCTSSILAVSCCLFSAFILLEGCICKLLTRSIVTFVIAPPCVSPEACN
jgi:hypothetical protein